MTNAMISSEEAQSYQSKGLSPRRRTYEVGMRGLLYLSAGITCLLLLFLIGYILYRGLPNLNWTFLTSQESVLRGTDGIMPAIQNHPLCHRGHPDLHPAPGGGGRHLPHRVRLQPQAGPLPSSSPPRLWPASPLSCTPWWVC